MKEIKFTKMQGTGNDYIYIDCIENRDMESLSDSEYPEIAKQLSDRHFSVGGDGVVFIKPSKTAGVKMKMFNADGSEGNICGNALRCIGKYCTEKYYPSANELSIETNAGIKKVSIKRKDGEITSVGVNMGKPVFDSRIHGYETDILGETYMLHSLSMGNPHTVIFCEEINNFPICKIGPLIEKHKHFPDRTNVEFVKVLSGCEIDMRVWERGSGETLSCGSGACAAAVAACECGFCDRSQKITVNLKGGKLSVDYTQDGVILEGNAQITFCGSFTYPL